MGRVHEQAAELKATAHPRGARVAHHRPVQQRSRGLRRPIRARGVGLRDPRLAPPSRSRSASWSTGDGRSGSRRPPGRRDVRTRGRPTRPRYRPKAPAPGKKRGERVFEQVLVPLRGGDLTVPSVSLTAFDPTSGRYVTRETPPLPVSVDAASAPGSADPARPRPSRRASPAPRSAAGGEAFAPPGDADPAVARRPPRGARRAPRRGSRGMVGAAAARSRRRARRCEGR